MVTETELDRMMQNYAATRDHVPVVLMLQGGASRGAATNGFASGLLSHPGIEVEAVGGTSAGAGAAAVIADGLAREKLQPATHGRRETLNGLADMYRVIAGYHPYNWLDNATREAVHTVDLGQRLMMAAPFAALSPKTFLQTVFAFQRNIAQQMKDAGRMMSMPRDMQQVALGQKHILEVVLEKVIGDTKAINSSAAPLLVANAVRDADGKHLLFHNRDANTPFQSAHYAASGALSPYLKLMNVPGVGECRDGAMGGANPPINEFLDLKDRLMPQGKARVVILYNLSSADQHLEAELAARAPELHHHFLESQAKKQREVAEFKRNHPGMQLIEVDAALTPEQRRASLADTHYERLSALYAVGQKQGVALAQQLAGDMPAPVRGTRVRETVQRRPALGLTTA